MKKLFLVDAYALIFKYYYAFMGRPMRNRAGMNTSVVFGFTKFLRDIQKREHPDLLGVAFDPKGGSIGLSLCKQIMNLHGGSISASSEIGKGSCFTLKFLCCG